MHKNYNCGLHILDMHVERGETSVFTLKTNSSIDFANDSFSGPRGRVVKSVVS